MRTMKHLAIAAMTATALALAGCGGGSGPASMMEESTLTPAQLATTASDLLDTAETDVNAVMDDSDGATVTTAEVAVAAAEKAVAAASAADNHAALSQRLGNLQGSLTAKKSSRQTAMSNAAKAANMAMAVTATKLYAGIHASADDASGTGTDDVYAAYNEAGTPAGSTADTLIMVTIGTGGDSPTAGTAVPLSEDKKTTVAANQGWAGKRYADPAGGDSYEAIVYSNVEAPKMGRKFGSDAAVTATGAFEYQLNDNDELASASFVPANVAFTGVTRTAGTETFNLPDPNDVSQTRIRIPGSYHGVSGNYYCTPGTPANGCSAAVASSGFTVSAGDTWVFAPGDANARVTEAADLAYASYGWWLKKAANNGPFTASAFVDVKGVVAAASDLNALNGTAVYMGGAAGKYSLRGDTGGTNDAGHFTARAKLDADFTNNTTGTAISGTIYMFEGADGMRRNWEVELKGSTIGDAGAIGNDGTSTTSPGGTVWTIDEVASGADGNWSGSLLDQPTDGDGVPLVATGTFYSTYGDSGNDGKMIGAFGANKQEQQ